MKVFNIYIYISKRSRDKYTINNLKRNKVINSSIIFRKFIYIYIYDVA